MTKNIKKKFTRPQLNKQFNEIVEMIRVSRAMAYDQVNTVLLDLYWNLGKIIHGKLKAAEWRDSVAESLAGHIQKYFPNLRGLTRANLFRMRQFHETFSPLKKVTPLVRLARIPDLEGDV